jgi:hypothetical protein
LLTDDEIELNEQAGGVRAAAHFDLEQALGYLDPFSPELKKKIDQVDPASRSAMPLLLQGIKKMDKASVTAIRQKIQELNQSRYPLTPTLTQLNEPRTQATYEKLASLMQLLSDKESVSLMLAYQAECGDTVGQKTQVPTFLIDIQDILTELEPEVQVVQQRLDKRKLHRKNK